MIPKPGQRLAGSSRPTRFQGCLHFGQTEANQRLPEFFDAGIVGNDHLGLPQIGPGGEDRIRSQVLLSPVDETVDDLLFVFKRFAMAANPLLPEEAGGLFQLAGGDGLSQLPQG
jgi:hypothetical protein